MYIGFILPNGKHHVSVAFCGHNESEHQYKRAVRALATAADHWGAGPLELTFGTEVERFLPSKAWYAGVYSPDMLVFHDQLVKQLEYFEVDYSKEFDFTPHVTLSYFPKQPKNPYAGIVAEARRISVVSNEFGNTDILI